MDNAGIIQSKATEKNDLVEVLKRRRTRNFAQPELKKGVISL